MLDIFLVTGKFIIYVPDKVCFRQAVCKTLDEGVFFWSFFFPLWTCLQLISESRNKSSRKYEIMTKTRDKYNVCDTLLVNYERENK